MSYIPTIGLEIHAELKTRTKMFCGCLNDPDERHPNVHVCPVCLGHPGTLPTINKKAVEEVIRVGLALGGNINPQMKFDRKNYFYPDLPKGYQISQYDQPIVSGGSLNGVAITRIHLEEDAGRLAHIGSSSTGSERPASLVDYNRASVPLMELVTEPDIKSSEEAGRFARELQMILRYLGASDADMEKGQMRLEANVSIRPRVADSRELDADQRGNGEPKSALGTKVEVKNINSFKALELAILYETKRQEEVLEKGEKVKQETRGWDDVNLKTVSQRSKEEAHDYRYFPDPDLPPFEASFFDVEKLKLELPELPEAKRERFMREFGLDAKQTDVVTSSKELAAYFEEAVSELGAEKDETTTKASIATLFNYLMSDILGLMKTRGETFETLKITPEKLADLVSLVSAGKIGSRQAKDLLVRMIETGADPHEIVTEEGLETMRDESALEAVIIEIIAENPVAVADYKNGKTASVQFLIGKAMAKLRGRGEPGILKELFIKNLES